MPKTYRKGKGNTDRGVPTHKATGVKTLGADAYGPQRPLGSMSLAPKAMASEAMHRSSSGRKRSR